MKQLSETETQDNVDGEPESLSSVETTQVRSVRKDVASDLPPPTRSGPLDLDQPSNANAPSESSLYVAADRIVERFGDTPAEENNSAPIHLCWGSSSFDVSEHVDLSLSAQDALVATTYGNPFGQIALRETIADYYWERLGVSISPERICVTDGASGALTLALLALLNPGDRLVIPSVAYFGYRGLASLLGLEPSYASLDDDFLYDLNSVKRSVESGARAVIVNSPSNPHGTALTEQAAQGLLDLGVPLIADEVYDLLGEDGPTRSLVSFSRDHFVVNSVSKAFALPGLRIGYLIVPPRYLGVVRDIKAMVNLTTSQTAQIIARRVLKKWRIVSKAHLEYVGDRRQALTRLCESFDLKLVLPPRSGMFGLIDVSDACADLSLDTLDISWQLASRHRVLVAPGADFAQHDPQFLRLNLGTDLRALHEGVRRIWHSLPHCGPQRASRFPRAR